MSSDLTIRDADPADAAALATFARAVFHESFEWGNDAADMEAYTSVAFTPAAQRAEIEDAGVATMLVHDAAGDIVAFAQLAARSPSPFVEDMATAELKRFYVSASLHGSGLAHRMMGEVLERARAAGATAIWLGVWAPNARAITFYGRHGFVLVGTQVFVLGTDPQTDLVMARRLADAPPR